MLVQSHHLVSFGLGDEGGWQGAVELQRNRSFFSTVPRSSDTGAWFWSGRTQGTVLEKTTSGHNLDNEMLNFKLNVIP